MCSIPLVAFASPSIKHNEIVYQQAWCSMHNGTMEYKNADETRIDCLTENEAVEFDFAKKWAEGIGQALHYGLMTGKKPKVVLILDNPERQMVYFQRVQKLAEKYNFEAEYITNSILTLDKDGKCNVPQCRCHKVKSSK